MAAFHELTLNGTLYTSEQIKSALRISSQSKLSENELQTLRFCRAWLRGAQTFTVRSSGSTGVPKQIEITREQIVLSARQTSQALGLAEGDHALSCLAPTYIGGLMMLARALVLGLRLTVVEPVSNPFRELSADKMFDFTALVPMQLQTVLDSNCIGWLNRMKAILLGGAPVSSSLRQELHQIKAPIFQTFGMTETVSHIALRRLNGATPERAYSIFPNVQIATDLRGCLTIQSPLTRNEKIVTNDLVQLESATSFVWLGRFDNAINSGGVKVAAERIESAVSSALLEANLDCKREFVALGRDDDKLGEMVVVLFSGEPFDIKERAKLTKVLARILPKHARPQIFYYTDSLTKTKNGKIDRAAARNQLSDSSLRSS